MAAQNEMSEAKYVNDWIKNQHPKALVYPRMRVGPWPNGDRNAGVLRVFPDAILIEDGKVVIVEAKTKPDTRALGQIELYADLFPATPEFYFAKDFPIRKVLLTTRDDMVLRPFAEKKGIDYVVYLPDWLRVILEARALEFR